MSRICMTLTLSVCLAAPALAQVTFDASFENGKLAGTNLEGDGTWTVNSNLSNWDWTYFKVSGVQGQQVNFRTPSTSGEPYGVTGATYHRMVYRYEGQTDWQHMDNGLNAADGHYYFSNNTAFTGDNVEIAYWQPYTYTQTTNFYNSVAASPYVTNRGTVSTAAPSGGSYHGRDLYRFDITDTSVSNSGKHHVVIVARQHGYESLGNYVTEGLVNWATGNSAEAQSLREKAIIHVYPMANPDAVVESMTREGYSKSGTTSDFNRDWNNGTTASDSYEIDALRQDILAATGGDGAIFIDMHAHAKSSASGAANYWWAYPDDQAALDFVTDARDADLAMNGETVFEWPNPLDGNVFATTAGAWGSSTLNSESSFTFETIASPFGTPRSTDRIIASGAAIGIALDANLAEVPEPASISLLGLGGLAMLRKRRK